VAIVGVVLLPLFDTQPAQLSAYSDHWNDLSRLREIFQEWGLGCRTILTSPKELSGLDGSHRLLVIMGVERSYSPDETNEISRFLRSGGSMLLADDFGHGDELLKALTAGQINIRTDHLRDINFLKNPDFVVVRSRDGGFMGMPARQLVLNRPAALDVIRPTMHPYHPEVLINASPHAWLDTNRNLVRDEGEREYAYPVATHFRIEGSGDIVVASDPGMFVNDMMKWNADYIRDLINCMMPDRIAGFEVIFEESRHNPDSATGKLGSGLLRMAAGYSGNPLAILMTFIFVSLIFGYQYMALPQWNIRRHRDVLDKPRLLHFTSPWVSIHEFRRLRVAIVERVRLAYGYSPEEFYPAMLPSLHTLIGDPHLLMFLECETYPDIMSFQSALQRALAWRPPQNADGAGVTGPPLSPYAEVELVQEDATGTLDIDGLISGPAHIWNPAGQTRGGNEDVDSILYGRAPPKQNITGNGGREPQQDGDDGP
jgi:hypothetical protein